MATRIEETHIRVWEDLSVWRWKDVGKLFTMLLVLKNSV